MKTRFRLFQRASGVFYIEDTETLRQESLKTKDKQIAQRLSQAKNAAHEQPALNLQLARTYLAASDPAVAKRTWQNVMNAVVDAKEGVTRERWARAVKDHAFDDLRQRQLLATRAEHLLSALKKGTVATNVFARAATTWPLPHQTATCGHQAQGLSLPANSGAHVAQRGENPLVIRCHPGKPPCAGRCDSSH